MSKNKKNKNSINEANDTNQEANEVFKQPKKSFGRKV